MKYPLETTAIALFKGTDLLHSPFALSLELVQIQKASHVLLKLSCTPPKEAFPPEQLRNQHFFSQMPSFRGSNSFGCVGPHPMTRDADSVSFRRPSLLKATFWKKRSPFGLLLR